MPKQTIEAVQWTASFWYTDAVKWFSMVTFVLLCATVGALLYGGYRFIALSNELMAKKNDVSRLEHSVQELTEKLSAAETLAGDLQIILRARSEESSLYNAQLQQLASTVSMLDKLSKTDKELLQKYSSVYFLNENYVPLKLATIPSEYLYRTERSEEIHGDIWPHLERLLADAAQENIDLKILSAYRSFGKQADLKAQYKVQYGSGTANTFSAEQGFSEHQLASTLDFTTSKLGANLSGFDKTAAYTWLQDNAHYYGFTLSYPKDNPYFVYEPWHWRYVGVELATKLFTEKKSFYDLDQREINQFLVKIFE